MNWLSKEGWRNYHTDTAFSDFEIGTYGFFPIAFENFAEGYIFSKYTFHALIVGSTCTGKTTCLVMPYLRELLNNEVSICVLESNGELKKSFLSFAEFRGYTVYEEETAEANYYNLFSENKAFALFLGNSTGDAIAKINEVYENLKSARREGFFRPLVIVLDNITEMNKKNTKIYQQWYRDGLKQGVRICNVLQSFTQLSDEVVELILCNTAYQVFFATSSPSDSKKIAELCSLSVAAVEGLDQGKCVCKFRGRKSIQSFPPYSDGIGFVSELDRIKYMIKMKRTEPEWHGSERFLEEILNDDFCFELEEKE